MNIEALAALSLAEVRSAAEQYSRLKGFSLNSLTGAFRITLVVVKQVEKVGLVHGLKGADKQALAVELLLKLVKLPWWLPASFLRQILPPVIDAVVEALKDKLG